MPRWPDREAKTLRLVLSPKPGQEEKIRAFKELIRRNGLKIGDILFERVEEFLKEHNWPPGNSQTVINTFIDEGELKEGIQQIFNVQIKTAKNGSLNHQAVKTIQVTERTLQQVHLQWQDINERGKQSWLRILRQIDHPLAHEILKSEKDE